MDIEEFNQFSDALLPRMQRVVAEENKTQLTEISKRMSESEARHDVKFANHEQRIVDLEKTKWRVSLMWAGIVAFVTLAYNYGKDFFLKRFH